MAAAVTSSSDKAADLLEKLSLDSQTKTEEIIEPLNKVKPGDNGSVMYHQGYGYMPYPSPVPTVSGLGHDGQAYELQDYHYPGPFYQSSGSAATGSNYASNAGSRNRNDGARPSRPTNQNSFRSSSISHKRGVSPSGFDSPGFYGSGYGYDGFQSPVTWFDPSMFSNGPSSRYAPGARFSPPSATSGMSGFMNLTYPNNRVYGQYGNRDNAAFGSFGTNSWTNGHGWVVVDNKYKPRSHGYGDENVDSLSELNRGPRAKGFKNQQEFRPATQAVRGQNLSSTENNKDDNVAQIPDKEQYNKGEFPEDYSDAKFFVIKSYSEDDVHKSIKYSTWSSTSSGNKKLDAAYNHAKENGCPVFLLFSVNTSGQFVGLAEMVGPVDFNRSVQYWQQDKWIGCFPVKWHIIKDVPNGALRHITLENNENKPVTNSRDTQEVPFEKGIQVLKIFKNYNGKTSILDDFGFYAARERIMQEKRAKQNTHSKVSGGNLGDDMTNRKDSGATINDTLPDSSEAVSINGEAKLVKGNASGGPVTENSMNASSHSIPSSENGVITNVVANAC